MTANSQVSGDPSICARPYTAGQIRDFCSGKTMVHRVEQGDSVHLSESQFIAGDEEVGSLIVRTLSVDGKELAPDSESEIRWIELRNHATFPAERTVVTDATCQTPAGDFECWLYTVSPETEGQPVSRFFFAKERPGAPVLFESEAAGNIVYRMILVEERS